MTATVEKLHATVDELEVSMDLAMEEADLICYEETATNEEAIKDVQDAQLNLTQAIQILMDFYLRRLVRPFILHHRVCFPKTGPSKVLQRKSDGRCQFPWLSTSDSDGSSARLESETTADESETVSIFDEFTGKVVESVWSVILDSYQRFCPTVVQSGANVTLEDYEDALHQMIEKA